MHLFSPKKLAKEFYGTPFWPKIEILLRTVQMHYERSRFSWWHVKVFMMTCQDFIMNGLDFRDSRSRFYYERSRFSWWQVEIFMVKAWDFIMNSWDFHDSRSRFYHEQSRFSWWQVEFFMVGGQDFHDNVRSRISAKFRSTREVSHHLDLMDK